MKKQVIGITGGIGCGKTIVMDILKKEYGASIILADKVGHDLMKPGEINYNGIIEKFGTGILSENGEIDRKKLGAIVFSNQEYLTALNNITHTNIVNEIENRIKILQREEEVPFICLESAILFDTPLYTFCDTIWYIYAREEVRIERLMSDRGYTKEYCKTVMDKQKKEEVYKDKSDLVIDNSESLENTLKQIKYVIEK